MMKPERLKKGDRIGIIAPASPLEMEEVWRAVPFFEEMGLQVKLGKHIDNVYGYLAGTDEQRLADFHDMIADKAIKAIFCARGGYGTGRIAGLIDYQLIRQNPKIIWGYSDITYLLTSIRQESGLVTFHGPMPASDIAKESFDEFSISLFQQLFKPAPLFYTEDITPLTTIVPGETTGEIVGGNLSLLVSTLGTPHEIDTEGKLLLLEDIGEEPYRVDAMLNQLKLADKLHHTAGVMVGDFAAAEPGKEKSSLSLEQVFHHYLSPLKGPVISGFKIGHCMPNFSLPLGASAELSTSKKTLTIEPGVN